MSKSIYLRWIGANSLAELLGLGATLGIGIAVFGAWEPATVGGILLQYLVMVSSGLLEGALVGYLQWRVLRLRLAMPARAWLRATILGALLAWALGALPMTIIALVSLNQPAANGAAAAEPPAGLLVLLEAGLGLFAGAILSLLQMRALRRYVPRAGWWLAANALAWALGMPLIFAAMDLAFRAGSLAGSIAVVAGGLALTGALVGAVHGLALVRMVRQPLNETT